MFIHNVIVYIHMHSVIRFYFFLPVCTFVAVVALKIVIVSLIFSRSLRLSKHIGLSSMIHIMIFCCVVNQTALLVLYT